MPEDCLFCRIVAGEVPADVVHESGTAVAFRDANPQAPVHVLVVPRRHEPDLATLTRADADAASGVLRAIADVAEAEGVAGGYRIVLNTGASAGQSVFHVHAHVLGGRDLAWPPG
ncbi:MAG: histidine triad nucleotide-binding protein [Nocardioidaceae bacterium]|nr:histidine triad nucleotide-binding protein [Nocardioidaceae bacterium]